MEFKEGEKVNFCRKKRVGKCFNFSTLTGKILAVNEKTLVIKVRKKLFEVNKIDVTHFGQRTALTKAVMSTDNGDQLTDLLISKNQ